MTTKFAISGFSRRQFLSTTAAAALMGGVSVPKFAFGAEKVVKIGFLAPLTGPVAAWGKPGLDGLHIWADRVNGAGGIPIGDDTYKVEFIAYDEEYDAGKARTGAVKLIGEDKVKFIMMLGGDPWPGVSPVADKEKMLVSTLLPSDLTPETKMLVAPCEVHPIYNVTGVEWLAENKPELKTAVICAQDDSLGKPSVATYLAAFEAAGIKVLGDPIFFDPATTDFAPIMSKMLAEKPDILCLDTCYADYVHPLTEQAFQQGFKGQIISCTADFYTKMIDKTSKEFMQGFIFQFPDFDDPALNEPQINFKDPNGFYEEFKKRFGEGEWSAVSWEYA
ncbi:MAG: ABC transporter substrate-binding protein, partial [Methyloceanibacter sp.]